MSREVEGVRLREVLHVTGMYGKAIGERDGDREQDVQKVHPLVCQCQCVGKKRKGSDCAK